MNCSESHRRESAEISMNVMVCYVCCLATAVLMTSQSRLVRQVNSSSRQHRHKLSPQFTVLVHSNIFKITSYVFPPPFSLVALLAVSVSLHGSWVKRCWSSKRCSCSHTLVKHTVLKCQLSFCPFHVPVILHCPNQERKYPSTCSPFYLKLTQCLLLKSSRSWH